ncbi:MAG TPA: acyltransferase family protein, partial [Steroidobacteraceae bacterium]|nr:acyltransferase family protein [Steroidobacteraceae bacterium]
LLYHADFAGFRGGFVGVDIFFVISGFLITGLILPEVVQGTFSVRSFYERRIRRIFPALYTVLAFTAVVAVLLLLPTDLKSFARSLVATTYFASNFFFNSQAGYFDTDAHSKPLLHTWSLAVEEQYYILFPLCLVAVQRYLGGRHKLFVWLVVLGSLYLSVTQTPTHPDRSFYLAHTRAWELGLGALLALGAFPRAHRRVTRNAAALVGAALVVFAVGWFSAAIQFPGIAATVPCVGAALIIWSGTGGPNVVGRILQTKPFVAIGLISYSLYLWHWPLLVFAEYWTIRDLTRPEAAGVLVIAAVAAALSWRYVERPFRGKSGVLTRRALFAVAAAAMLVTAGLGRFVVSNAGFPGRLDPTTASLMAGIDDRRPRNWKCGNRNIRDVRSGDLCRVGASGDVLPSFVIWGDSHARAMADVVGEAAARGGRAGLLATRNGCGPLLGLDREPDPQARRCPEFAAAVLQFIADDPALTDVILIGRWAGYAEGTRYKNERGSGSSIYLRDAETRELSMTENQRVFARTLETTVDSLRAHGKTVWLVSAVPEVGWNVPSVLARMHRQDRAFSIAPTLEEYRLRQQHVTPVLQRLQAAGKLRILSPDEVLCQAGHCAIVESGRPLYSDDDHLSLTGAAKLSGMFTQIFPPAADAGASEAATTDVTGGH